MSGPTCQMYGSGVTVPCGECNMVLLDSEEYAALRARVAELERVGERGCFVLMEMMQAYERRVRSDCKTEDDIKARPWECAEYLRAAEYLRKVWTPATEKQP